MYAYLNGTVAHKGQNELIIDVMGVGYLLTCSMNTLQAAPPLGETMLVHTYLSVREDAMELFGFATKEEKRMFLRLTGVSGIGPKSALGILGSMPLSDLTLAILTGDVTALSRAPGVGKKTAQRIALELKERVTAEDMPFSGGAAPMTPKDGREGAVTEAILALETLGYTGAEAAKAVANVRDASDQADELIRLALRNMAGM